MNNLKQFPEIGSPVWLSLGYRDKGGPPENPWKFRLRWTWRRLKTLMRKAIDILLWPVVVFKKG